MFKAYVSFPITGRTVKEIETEILPIIKILKELGVEPLTPLDHVYSYVKKYGEPIGSKGNKKFTTKIFEEDIENLIDADFVVCILDRPSFGVGFELGLAYVEQKPIFLLAKGDIGKHPFVVPFKVSSLKELKQHIKKFIRGGRIWPNKSSI